MRVLIAEMKQETATFNPTPTRLEDFHRVDGAALLATYKGTETELAGAIQVLDQLGWECVPAMAAHAVSGGPIPSSDLEQLLDLLIDSIRAAGTVDGLYLCFHGAMAGESEGDPEGAALQRVRDLVGDIPLVVSLDLHAVLSDRMVNLADVLVPYHTYPHTDHFSTGQRATRVLAGLLRGEIEPKVARVPLPMLVRGDELLTATGRFGQAIGQCREFEASESGISAGVLIGNAFTDVPDLQSNVLVTSNGDLSLAEETARRIGRFMWDNRECFQATLTPLDQAIEQAHASAGRVVFSDAADATASGAAGDSNAILCGLVDAGFSKSTLLSLVDAPAVERAIECGIGNQTTISLGATRDPTRFTPRPFTCRVVSLHDGHFCYEDGTPADAGRAAVLQVESISILVTQKPVFVVGRRVYEEHGLDPRDFDVVVVKSPNGFRTWYEEIADVIIPVDVPGSTSANLKSLPFQLCVRPIFPLDEHVPSPFEDEQTS